MSATLSNEKPDVKRSQTFLKHVSIVREFREKVGVTAWRIGELHEFAKSHKASPESVERAFVSSHVAMPYKRIRGGGFQFLSIHEAVLDADSGGGEFFEPFAKPKPAEAAIGSRHKVELLRQRLENGAELWHDDDNPVFAKPCAAESPAKQCNNSDEYRKARRAASKEWWVRVGKSTWTFKELKTFAGSRGIGPDSMLKDLRRLGARCVDRKVRKYRFRRTACTT